MLPKLSIVMSVYNGEAFVAEAIESIINQTFTEFEFIIINDGSIDGTLKIIESYMGSDNRLVLVNREHRGLIYSLNEGVSLARSDFIARMDADDISHPERLEKQMEAIQKENADICGCHYYVINRFNKHIYTVLAPLTKESLILYLLLAVPFMHGSVLMRKSFLIDNGLEYGQGGKFAEDKQLWLQMFSLKAKIINVDDFLFYYREISTSKSQVESSDNKLDAKLMRSNFLKEHDSVVRESIDILIKNQNNLSLREVEHLLDLSYLYPSKYFKIARLAPARLLVISFFKFIARQF